MPQSTLAPIDADHSRSHSFLRGGPPARRSPIARMLAMFFRSRAARTLALVASLAAPGLLNATTLLTAQLAVNPHFSGGTGPVSLLQSDEELAFVSASATGGGDSSGWGNTWVQHGVIKLQGEFGGSGYSLSRGIFRDDLTLTDPNYAPGTAVDVTFAIEVRGDLEVGLVTGIAQAAWDLQADLGGGVTDLSRRGYLKNDGLGAAPVASGSPFGIFEATVRLYLGFAAPLYVQLEGSAQAGYNSTFARNWANYDLGQSLYWGGITQVSVAGQPISGYSVSSASGTDYRFSMAPVPEPGGVALMLAGLAVLAGLQRASARRSGR